LSTMANGGGARARFFREAVRSVGDLPGVEMASLAALVPLDGSNRAHRIEIGEGGLRRAEAVDTNIVGATYFELMNVPVVQGREFSTLDRDATPPVALVNKTMAMRFWNGDAIGRFFRDEESGADVRVVGIVGDLRHRSFAEAPLPMVYFSAGQRQATRMTLHVRTSVAPAAIGASVHRVLHELGPAAGIGRAETMAEFLDRVTMPQRMGGVAAGAVGVVELLLAVMALYGVIAYATSQRTREIGLRVALGAPIGSVTGLLMRHGVRLTFIGLVLGMVLALGAGQVAASLLIGVGSADPASFVITAVVLSSVAAVASYVPARRAARIDPGLALRAE
jgi:predicted permease